MEEKQYNKRFCFGRMGAFNPSMGQVENALIYRELENFEIFADDNCCFGILEIRTDRNFSDLKFNLKNHNPKKLEKSAIFDWLCSNGTRPLQRIFKKQPCDDHLTLKIDDYKRTVMTLELRNDPKLLREYIKIHRPENVWPQVLKNMDVMGIKDMELYLMGYQAFIIMDTTLDFNIEKDGEIWADLPREKEWQQYVAQFQKVDSESNATEKWKTMQQIVKS